VSVINQMLRDLDQQTVLAGLPQRVSLSRGERVVATPIDRAFDPARLLGFPRGVKVGALCAVLIGIGSAIWVQVGRQSAQPAASVVSVAAAQPAVIERPLWPVVMAEVAPSPPSALPAVVALAPRLPVARVLAVEKPVLASREFRSDPVPEVALDSVKPSSEFAVLAQAQSLWRSGSQDAAVEVLSQALAATEREQPGLSTLERSERLTSLVRELARMQLLLGQVRWTLDLLVRLAPVLSGSADIWAIRGNASQRLGQYQASVEAYSMALKIRPEEPRWMLGAAVSLASLGELKAAADMANKARAGGGASPEAIAYLKQLGVTLQE
jgi:MSHA biogenesis protein MshN